MTAGNNNFVNPDEVNLIKKPTTANQLGRRKKIAQIENIKEFNTCKTSMSQH